MSRHCGSCGGLLGQDCFNEYECRRITEGLVYRAEVEALREPFHFIVGSGVAFGIDADGPYFKGNTAGHAADRIGNLTWRPTWAQWDRARATLAKYRAAQGEGKEAREGGKGEG